MVIARLRSVGRAWTSGTPSRPLQPVVGADHELRDQVGPGHGLPFDAGQREPGFRAAVDSLAAAGELDEPVPLGRNLIES